MHAVALQAFEDLEQRQISFREGLEKPVFFQKPVILRMAHERKMRVQNEREITLGIHCLLLP